MNCIIACQQSYCSGLAERLNKATDHLFTEITGKSQLTLMALDKVKPDYIFFPHWSNLVPEEIHSRYQCIIFLLSDLPYGRGGSPLQNLVIRGHRHTMITAIKCVQELDAGPIYLKERLSLDGSAEDIFLRASGVIESMIIRILSDRPEPFNQEGEITIFNRRTPEQSDWSDASTLDEVHDRIRMLDAEGYPPAFVRVGPYKLEFSRASRNVDSVVADVSIRKVEE